MNQLAFLPAEAELQQINAISGVCEIRQAKPKFGNPPGSAFLLLSDGGWLKLHSESKDVQFKFECLRLSIGLSDCAPKDHEVSIHTQAGRGRAKLLFRADWLRPEPDEHQDDEWNRVVSNLATVNPVPTRELAGCLSWWGVLLYSVDDRPVLIHLDDFPLSIRITEVEADISEAVSVSCLVDVQEVQHWLSTIEGWSIAY